MKKLIDFDEKILVAGANGMVGKSVINNLIKKGYGLSKHNGKIFVPNRKDLNFLNINEVEYWFKNNKPTIVIVAAAKVGGIWANDNYPTEYILENLKIQNNIIETAWKNNVKRLLFLGSSCIYPKFAKQPIEEEYLLTGELETTNQWYAIAKIAGVKLCEALRKQHGFDAISLMPTNLYGPGDNYHPKNSHVIAAFIKKFYEATKNSFSSVTCWGTGSPYREFLHVDDLANAIIFALEKWDPNSSNSPTYKNGELLSFLNVGTGIDIKIKDLATKISKIAGYRGEIIWDTTKPDGTPRKLLNVDRFKRLGWEPNISLEKGIVQTLNSFEKEYYKLFFK